MARVKKKLFKEFLGPKKKAKGYKEDQGKDGEMSGVKVIKMHWVTEALVSSFLTKYLKQKLLLE